MKYCPCQGSGALSMLGLFLHTCFSLTPHLFYLLASLSLLCSASFTSVFFLFCRLAFGWSPCVCTLLALGPANMESIIKQNIAARTSARDTATALPQAPLVPLALASWASSRNLALFGVSLENWLCLLQLSIKKEPLYIIYNPHHPPKKKYFFVYIWFCLHWLLSLVKKTVSLMLFCTSLTQNKPSHSETFAPGHASKHLEIELFSRSDAKFAKELLGVLGALCVLCVLSLCIRSVLAALAVLVVLVLGCPNEMGAELVGPVPRSLLAAKCSSKEQHLGHSHGALNQSAFCHPQRHEANALKALELAH